MLPTITFNCRHCPAEATRTLEVDGELLNARYCGRCAAFEAADREAEGDTVKVLMLDGQTEHPEPAEGKYIVSFECLHDTFPYLSDGLESCGHEGCEDMVEHKCSKCGLTCATSTSTSSTHTPTGDSAEGHRLRAVLMRRGPSQAGPNTAAAWPREAPIGQSTGAGRDKLPTQEHYTCKPQY